MPIPATMDEDGRSAVVGSGVVVPRHVLGKEVSIIHVGPETSTSEILRTFLLLPPGKLWTLGIVLAALIGGVFTLGLKCGRGQRADVPVVVEPTVRSILLAEQGAYGWPWPGENWDGRLRFTEHEGSVQVDLSIDQIKKVWATGGGERLDVSHIATTESPGAVLFSGNSFSIVGLDMTFSNFAGREREQRVKLTIHDLKQVRAFTGNVTFEVDGHHKSEGGIVLVNHLWKN